MTITKKYLAVVVDVSGLTDPEITALAAEMNAQTEENEYHPDATPVTAAYGPAYGESGDIRWLNVRDPGGPAAH